MSVASLSPERIVLRRGHVGASEVAALFGLHPFLTRFELWHRKSGNLPEEDLSGNDRVFWGTVLEPAIAEGVRAKTGWALRKVLRYVQHQRIAGMGASPDYEILSHPKGVGTLQLKNVDGLVFREWEDETPPMVYQLQVQHEIACGGFKWGALGVLVGGNQLRVFEYERHEAAIEKIEREVQEFWRSIDEGREPKPDFQSDLETIRALYPTAEPGNVVDLTGDPRLAELCALYKDASAAEKAAGEAKDAAKAELLTLIKDAEIAFAKGFKISTSNVAEAEISYVRKAYRTFRVNEIKLKKGQ
jgi:putative phage-type endonuclease